MELIQVINNTWVLADWQLIPLYRTDENHCILLDSGLISQREGIEKVLSDHHLTPIGILGSHAHTDHSPNHRFFQEKYGIPVALSLGEATISMNPLMLKAYYYMLSPDLLLSYPEYAGMQFRPDRIIWPEEERISFCGAEFDIIRTPGHSPDHIAIRTPDGVLYLGDAVLSGASLTDAKLPYFFSIADAFKSMKSLKKLEETEPVGKSKCYITAHRGIHETILELVEENIRVVHERAEEICRMIDRPMTLSEAVRKICEELYLLSSHIRRSTYYERNIRTYLDYMIDKRMLEAFSNRGVTMLRPLFKNN